MKKRTLKDLIMLLESSPKQLIVSNRGNLYSCRIVDNKTFEKLKSFKSFYYQLHNVNYKDIIIATIWYKKRTYRYNLLIQENEKDIPLF